MDYIKRTTNNACNKCLLDRTLMRLVAAALKQTKTIITRQYYRPIVLYQCFSFNKLPLVQASS